MVAHVRMSPAFSATTPVRSLGVPPTTSTTVTAVGSANAMEPSPAWPSSLLPQHFTLPVARSAHECRSPTVMPTASLMPRTVMGVAEGVVVPSPSSPYTPGLGPLLQHFTLPEASSAHPLIGPTA